MRCTLNDTLTVERLVATWGQGLQPNPEYQRGERWSLPQKQAFIDSIFRGYPIPPLFIQRISKTGLFETQVENCEVVDGQQRLRAMHEYCNEHFPLLKAGDPKLKLPVSLRENPAPWAGKCFSELDMPLRERFLGCNLHVYVIEAVDNTDEVRDLFIRLQSGTALTRQEIRDAWPGTLGPYIASLVGRVRTNPSPRYTLFQVIGRWGSPASDDQDERDKFVADRQMCAQLMMIFWAREVDAAAPIPSVAANNVDLFYHQNTSFPTNGAAAKRFERVLALCEEVVYVARELVRDCHGSIRSKFKKLDIFSLALFFQAITRNSLCRTDTGLVDQLAIVMLESRASAAGKAVAGAKIQEYYDSWREHIASRVDAYVDPRRCFNEEQQKIISARQEGKCGVCRKSVDPGEAQYHHIHGHARGGRTAPENGMLVHARCHPPGSPYAEQ